MSKKSRKDRMYNCRQVCSLAHKLGLPGDTPHKDVARKLATYLGVENKNHRVVLSNYFDNPQSINGFVQFVPKSNTKKFIPWKDKSYPASMSGEVIITRPSNVASDTFLQTYEWRKLRLVALKLHGRKCQCCGASPETGAVMNVDHIKPRKIYPELALDINNLQVLCGECNHGKGNWDMTDFRENQHEIQHLKDIINV